MLQPSKLQELFPPTDATIQRTIMCFGVELLCFKGTPSQSDGSVLPSSWSDNRLNLWRWLKLSRRFCCSPPFSVGVRELWECDTEVSNFFTTSASLSVELLLASSSPPKLFTREGKETRGVTRRKS